MFENNNPERLWSPNPNPSLLRQQLRTAHCERCLGFYIQTGAVLAPPYHIVEIPNFMSLLIYQQLT